MVTTPRDPDPELAHPEAAGWVLGILDPDDADWFAGHLSSCPDCRAAVAEFRPTAGLLQNAAPAATPPPGLQAKTLAAIGQAASAARRGGRSGWWLGWSTRMLTLAAAVVLAAGVGIGLWLSAGSPAGESYAFGLHSPSGLAASGQVAMRQTGSSGWSVQLTVAHLPALKAGQFYECWWVGSDHRLVSAGTFTVGSAGAESVQMWTAADPDDFPTMQITVGTAASAGQQGQVILSGAVPDDD